MSNNQFSTFKSINGDLVVGFTGSKDVRDLKWLDSPKVATYLLDDEDTHTKHLGMVSLFATTHRKPFTLMRNLFANAAVLEVNPGVTVTYDLPVHRETAHAKVGQDTSTMSPYPGKGGTFFELVLDQEFQPGDVLTYDGLNGEQCSVSEQHPVEPVGELFRHMCQVSALDEETYFDPSALKEGVSYYKITNVISEFGTNYSAINLISNPVGTITNEFLLGDPRGVETFYTAKAAQMNASAGLKKVVDATRQKALDEMAAIGGNKDMYFMAKAMKDKETGMIGFDKRPKAVRIGPALEYFVLAELAQMESQALVFAKAGKWNTSQGSKMLNEGLYHQRRRGKIIRYARPGGLTLDHIHTAVQYIYKNSDMPALSRRVKFKAGTMAAANLQQLFRDEIYAQVNALPAFLQGQESAVSGKLFTGSLDALHMNAIVFKSVQIPGIGTIEIELDESLDNQPLTDKQFKGYHGNGASWTTYSLVIEDATNPSVSNVSEKVRGANLVAGGSTTSNTYYIKPEFAHVVFGYEQGRMANEGNTQYVQSSLKGMGRTFWAHSTSAALELDITKSVTIELFR